MKIRNILSVLFVGLLFTSCNSEEEVQRGNEDGRDISFSMTLTLGEVTAMTKAGGDIAEGYTYSTEDEVKVNNVVVAIFNEANGTVGECLEYKSVAFDGGIPNSTVTIVGKTLIAYKIDNIQFKEAEDNEVRCTVYFTETRKTNWYFKPVRYLGNWKLCMKDSGMGDKAI